MTVQWLGDELSAVPADLSGGVALVGDSLAVGLAGPLSKEFADVKFWSETKGGSDMWAWLTGAQASRFKSLLAARPAVLLVSLGTNDTALASSPVAATIRARVFDLVNRARAAGAEPVWLLPGKLPWSTEALYSAVGDSGATAVEQPDIKKPDGVHPDGLGYQTWAKHVASSVRAAGQRGVSRKTGLLAAAVLAGLGVAFVWATLRVAPGSRAAARSNPELRVGDRVRVVKPHGRGEMVGVVREVDGTAYAVQLGDKLHRWYVARELELLPRDNVGVLETALLLGAGAFATESPVEWLQRRWS